MKIIGKKINIEDIQFGHELEGHAFGYIMSTLKNENRDEAWKIVKAHEDGFECGIKWLANYLNEFGIQIELNDKIIPTIEKEHWYSGEIVKNNDASKIDELANKSADDYMYSHEYLINNWDKFYVEGFKAGYYKSEEM